jgi:hypothetical protein
MRNDGERASPLDFFFDAAHRAAQNNRLAQPDKQRALVGNRFSRRELIGTKRKETGHYSGLFKNNLNFFTNRSLQFAHGSLRFVPYDEIRIPRRWFSACHQMW